MWTLLEQGSGSSRHLFHSLGDGAYHFCLVYIYGSRFFCWSERNGLDSDSTFNAINVLLCPLWPIKKMASMHEDHICTNDWRYRSGNYSFSILLHIRLPLWFEYTWSGFSKFIQRLFAPHYDSNLLQLLERWYQAGCTVSRERIVQWMEWVP